MFEITFQVGTLQNWIVAAIWICTLFIAYFLGKNVGVIQTWAIANALGITPLLDSVRQAYERIGPEKVAELEKYFKNITKPDVYTKQ
jgi:hypothetical protein